MVTNQNFIVHGKWIAFYSTFLHLYVSAQSPNDIRSQITLKMKLAALHCPRPVELLIVKLYSQIALLSCNSANTSSFCFALGDACVTTSCSTNKNTNVHEIFKRNCKSPLSGIEPCFNKHNLLCHSVQYLSISHPLLPPLPPPPLSE